MYGVAFAMRGGVVTASHVLGRDLMKEFRAGRVIVDRESLPEHGPGWDPFAVSRGHTVKGARREELAQMAPRTATTASSA